MCTWTVEECLNSPWSVALTFNIYSPCTVKSIFLETLIIPMLESIMNEFPTFPDSIVYKTWPFNPTSLSTAIT
uniref:Uncharacterized protein n=1 Tax=Lepeophtheirus salmonis TaxID=72036 RepID=A0A0K2UR19_LEPSM